RLQEENSMVAWVLRLIGFVLMTLGIALAMNPLQVLSDVIPFVGRIVGMGIGLFALVAAAFFSLTTIGIAWIFYRPVMAGLLIAAAVAIVVLVGLVRAKKEAVIRA